MIIGIDHLAYNANSLDEGAALFSEKGFQSRFESIDTPNAPEKTPFLHTSVLHHSIALYDHAEALSIEVTCHALSRHKATRYGLVGPKEIVLYTKDCAAEHAFWQQAMGFVVEDEHMLQCRAPMPAWSGALQLAYVENTVAEPAMLDDLGYSCVCCLSTNIARDVAHIQTCGAMDMSPIFEQKINDKMLKIVLLRTPTGAIVELIQPQ